MKTRKIFFVVASGGHDTDKHYYDTIKNKRTIKEASQFLKPQETETLNNYYHGRPYAVWGATPGTGNIRTWEIMEPGDYVMIYRNGHIILAAEVAMKVRNPALAKYLWSEDKEGKTWELMYFLINEVEVNVKQSDLNGYLGYKDNYFPRGFMAIDQEKTNILLQLYGDLLSILQRMEKGEKVSEITFGAEKLKLDEQAEINVDKSPTIHDEIQWRLIRLGNRAHFDVWVPSADQNRSYEGQIFNELVIPEFQEAIDVPKYIKNIDSVWKLGFSIKAAFEIEHSTQIFSGLLRLSDLKALAPNSNYPLFIVAERDKKNKVFDQLRRPTFSNEYLKLDKITKFLSYDNIRELDEATKAQELGYNIDWLLEKAESLN